MKKTYHKPILMRYFYLQEIRLKNSETNDTLRQEVLQLNNAKKVLTLTFLLQSLPQNSVYLCLVKA